MITCNDAVKQLWDYLEGDLDEEDRHAVQEHLDLCKRCCGEAEFATELKVVLASNAVEELPEETKTRLTGFLEQL